MMSYTSNSYGYQRPNPMGYSQPQQGMMGSAGVYAGAPVVSFPAPPGAPLASQAKPYYRCWDNVQKKWFYWEKDSSVTSWTEPASQIILIDHETGSIVQRDAAPAAAARAAPAVPSMTESVASHSSTNVASSYATGSATRLNHSLGAGAVSQQSSSKMATQQRTVQPNYSAGVSRYTQPGSMGSSQSTISAAEKSRLEEADRLIAEQLQKQLSMEAEAELVASCPLPGEAAKIVANQKKKFNFSKPSKQQTSETTNEKDLEEMAKHGFVVKKQKPKATKNKQ